LIRIFDFIEDSAIYTNLITPARNRARLTICQTYIAKCARCHLVVSPSAYPPAAWPQHVDSMRERSSLTDVQRNMIVQYVQAFARRP
jgi:Dihaem cytochrome c